ncbi:MAG: hypothetical protein HYZ58_12645, partial [Acidobacteria bacterium]|nr:hypothetical protein [Acidobacteriota bacterium]
MPVPRLEQFAVIVDPGRDNVALAKVETPPGHYTVGGREIEVLEPLGPGERLALRDIPAGDFLVQYACPFAVSKGLRRGE